MEKSLRRPTDDRIIGGVCSALGHYFDVDAALIRVAWVLGTILAGGGPPGIALYLLAWWVIPDEYGQRSPMALLLVLLLVVLPALCVACCLPCGILGSLTSQ